jgi:hypothetical protein
MEAEKVVEEVELKEGSRSAPSTARVGAEPAGRTIDRERVDRLMEQIREEENFPLALIAGAGGALLGAALWGIVTAVTKYKIGWMAMAVGIVVGGCVRVAGKGMRKPFGVAGAALALSGCLLGNALVVYLILAESLHVSFLQVVQGLPSSQLVAIMKATATPLDILFYGIAVYEGYRFSFRRVTVTDVARLDR